jgi:hypothetical protein
MSCRKRRYDRLGAMLALAECKNGKKGSRCERAYYWCPECRAYHLTSQEVRSGDRNSEVAVRESND